MRVLHLIFSLIWLGLGVMFFMASGERRELANLAYLAWLLAGYNLLRFLVGWLSRRRNRGSDQNSL